MYRSAVTLAAASGLIGCAAQETALEPMTIPYIAPLDEAPFGVADIWPSSDVADLTPAYRHVVFPRDSFPPLAEIAAVTSPRAPVPFQAPPVEPEPLSPPPPAPQGDPVYAAWYKYCIGTEDMTAADWKTIDTSLMPPALADIWAEHCIPIK